MHLHPILRPASLRPSSSSSQAAPLRRRGGISTAPNIASARAPRPRSTRRRGRLIGVKCSLRPGEDETQPSRLGIGDQTVEAVKQVGVLSTALIKIARRYPTKWDGSTPSGPAIFWMSSVGNGLSPLRACESHLSAQEVQATRGRPGYPEEGELTRQRLWARRSSNSRGVRTGGRGSASVVRCLSPLTRKSAVAARASETR